MDMEKRLEEICKRYGLQKMGGEYQREINRLVAGILHQTTANRAGRGGIAIRGAGEHTEKLFELMPDKSYIAGIYDNFAQSGEICGIKTYPVRDMLSHDIDTVILSSYGFRGEMAEEISGWEKEFAVLDIYEELEKQGCCLDEAFYLRSRYFYSDIIYLQNRYREAKSAGEQVLLLRQIIAAYIQIKDFHSAFEYIREYEDHQYDGYERYQSLRTELEELLGEIQGALKMRGGQGKRDIIVHLCDSVRYDSFGDLPYLSELFGKGVLFENAYTPTPYTKPAVAAMLFRLHVIEDYYDINNGWEQNPVLSLVRDRGYRFLNIEGSYCFDNLQIETFGEEYNRAILPECLWTLWRELLENREPVFALLYSAVETHMPWMSPNQTDPAVSPRFFQHMLKSDRIKSQQRQALSYVDNQYRFFERMMDYDYDHIFMSDHGTWQDIDERRWEDKALHTVLAVRGAGIRPAREERMFSLLNFYELTDWLTDRREEKYEKIFSDDVSFQDVEFFSRAYVESFVRAGKQRIGMAFRGIRGRHDKFVRCADGREYYFLLPDEKKNYIYNPDYQDRIEELRHKAGDYFMDVYAHEAFKFARRLYETL